MSHRRTETHSTHVAMKYRRVLQFTHNYVFLSDPGMQVVYCYFCPLQRTEGRLEKNMTCDQADGMCAHMVVRVNTRNILPVLIYFQSLQ